MVMRILSIETSADETAVSVVEVTGDFPDAIYELKGNALKTQIEMHVSHCGDNSWDHHFCLKSECPHLVLPE